jgi:hypothetical protein
VHVACTSSLQAFASLPGKHAVLQETSAQHFPQVGLHSASTRARRTRDDGHPPAEPTTPLSSLTRQLVRTAPQAPASVSSLAARGAAAAAAAAAAAGNAGGREALPQEAYNGSTGDWETRAFFPRLGPVPPQRCRCEPTSGLAVPLRTQLLRNLSRAYPAVHVLPIHSLLQPRHGWHQQDCKVREQARAAGSDRVGAGCDCTHYCYSPMFWRVYFRSLLEQLEDRQLGFSSLGPRQFDRQNSGFTYHTSVCLSDRMSKFLLGLLSRIKYLHREL